MESGKSPNFRGELICGQAVNEKHGESTSSHRYMAKSVVGMIHFLTFLYELMI